MKMDKVKILREALEALLDAGDLWLGPDRPNPKEAVKKARKALEDTADRQTLAEDVFRVLSEVKKPTRTVCMGYRPHTSHHPRDQG